jgi:hypothetical protein
MAAFGSATVKSRHRSMVIAKDAEGQFPTDTVEKLILLTLLTATAISESTTAAQ